MNIQINRKNLSDALIEVGAIVGKNKILPLYNNVKFVTKGDRIRLQASDTENTIRKYLVATSIDQDTDFLVDCKSVSDYLKALKDDDVTIEVADHTFTIKHKKGKASFPTLDAADFYEPKLTDECKAVQMPSSILVDAIENGMQFVSTDDFRPVMQNIHAEIKAGKFSYCATDTRKLVLDEIPFGDEQIEFEWIISAATASFIANAARKVVQVTISDYESMVSYHMGDTMIFAQKIHGNFPDGRRVIPKDNSIVVETDKKEFLEAIKRATLLVSAASPQVKLSVSMIDIAIVAEDLDKGKRATENVAATSNTSITIGFSAQFLKECVDAYGGDKLKITLKDPSRPLLLVDDTHPFKSILLMPMSV